MEVAKLRTKARRVIRSGVYNFWRNSYVSMATILVMVVTLSVIGSVFFVNAILNIAMTELKSKVDINVYFNRDVSEEDALTLRAKIDGLIEVASTTYISRDEALADFKKRHENDQTTMQALSELDENPLSASLNIRAKEPSAYQGIATFLNSDDLLTATGTKIISKINYFENKSAIDRLARIINSVERISFGLSLALIIISVIITLNTIRLTIYISREEISVMQLVGASKNYVKGPFVVTGVFVGFISAVITLLLYLPVTYWLGNTTESFFVGLNMFDYYLANFFEIGAIVIGAGIIIGAVSSLIAVRKYLNW